MWQIYAVSITIRIVVSKWWLMLHSIACHLCSLFFFNPFIQVLFDIMIWNIFLFCVACLLCQQLGFMLLALIWKFDFPPFMVLIIAILNDGSFFFSFLNHEHLIYNVSCLWVSLHLRFKREKLQVANQLFLLVKSVELALSFKGIDISCCSFWLEYEFRKRSSNWCVLQTEVRMLYKFGTLTTANVKNFD